MSNPFSGIISSEFLSLWNNAIDALLEDDSLVLVCRLFYGDTKFTVCSNCEISPITMKSTGRYKTGGSISFPSGTSCPYCGGEGKLATESTEDISLMVIWDSLDFNKLFKGVGSPPLLSRFPAGQVRTLSKFSTTYSKLKRAKEISFDTSIEDYTSTRYAREGEPEIISFGSSRYILTTWQRVGS